jgi:hypothetical protein
MTARDDGPDRVPSASLSPFTDPSGYHLSFKETRDV